MFTIKRVTATGPVALPGSAPSLTEAIRLAIRLDERETFDVFKGDTRVARVHVDGGIDYFVPRSER